MAGTTLAGISIRGICSAAPAATQGMAELAQLVGEKDAPNVAQLTGVRTRHIARADQTTSDLCAAAAEKLLTHLGWARESVEALVFVTETPDYDLPATACCLQTRLGLSTSCAAFDVNLGCSGYVYGLWIASSLMMAGCRRVLLLAGETTSKIVSPLDRAAVPLFGDAGTATALEKNDAASQIHFELGTDGRGFNHLIMPVSGFRTRRTAETGVRTQREGGVRSDEDVHMNGPEIFTFTLREVPKLIAGTLARAGWSRDEVDGFVLHQANRFMLNHLAKKMGIPYAKMPLALDEFGNTSSASIPLAISHCLRQTLAEKSQRLLLAGFGVGLSWGGVALELGPMDLPPVLLVP